MTPVGRGLAAARAGVKLAEKEVRLVLGPSGARLHGEGLPAPGSQISLVAKNHNRTVVLRPTADDFVEVPLPIRVGDRLGVWFTDPAGKTRDIGDFTVTSKDTSLETAQTTWASATLSMAKLLQSGSITRPRDIGGAALDRFKSGSGGAHVVTVVGPGGEQMDAVRKFARNEQSFPYHSHIPRGQYYRREASMWKYSETAGLGVVPQTVAREEGGEAFSLQRFAVGAKLLKDWHEPMVPLDRLLCERLRAFDYGFGNQDRNAYNLMAKQVGGKRVPQAIDNGLSLPEGPANRFAWPYNEVKEQTGRLLPETTAWIRAQDLRAIGGAIAADGYPPAVATHSLRRWRAIQLDPSVLQVEHAKRALALGPTSTQGLSPGHLEELDGWVKQAYGK